MNLALPVADLLAVNAKLPIRYLAKVTLFAQLVGLLQR